MKNPIEEENQTLKAQFQKLKMNDAKKKEKEETIESKLERKKRLMKQREELLKLKKNKRTEMVNNYIDKKKTKANFV